MSGYYKQLLEQCMDSRSCSPEAGDEEDLLSYGHSFRKVLTTQLSSYESYSRKVNCIIHLHCFQANLSISLSYDYN